MTKNIVSPLQQVFNAAVNVAKSDDVLRKAVIAAGGNQEGVRNMAIAGRMSHALKVSQESALLALGKKGNPKHLSDKGDDVRTIDEEKAYGAARVWWSARLKAWGIATSASQGGDRTKVVGDETPMDTDKLELPKKPKVGVDIELGAYLLANAQGLYDFFKVNANHEAVTSDLGSNLMGITCDFLNAIKEEISKHTT